MARGSILERAAKDGTLTYYIKYRDSNGRQVKTAIGPSRREAEKELTAALSKVDAGQMKTTTETFQQYAERWLVEHRPRVEHSTYLDYSNTITNHLIPSLGDLKLSKITTERLRAYVAGKLDGTAPIRDTPKKGRHGRIKRKLAPKTVNNQVTLLALILGHAMDDGIIGQNPAAGRDRRRPLKVKVHDQEQDFLRADEVPVYLDGCTAFWRPRALTIILTGMRVGELVTLEWGDIDWRGRAIVVRRSLKADGTTGSTKGDETGRRIDMSDHLAGVLRDLRAQAEEHGDGEGLVFPHPSGGVDTPGRLLDLHRDALKDAGLRTSLKNHELRHTAAAVWLSLGLGLEYVRRQMGHKSIQTTISNYGHLEPSLMPDAADRAAAAILGTGTTAGTTTPTEPVSPRAETAL